MVASARQSSELTADLTAKDFQSAYESDVPKNVPNIFRCGFQVVDGQLKGKTELFEIWNEYKPFLEFLISKVDTCIKKYGETEAKR